MIKVGFLQFAPVRFDPARNIAQIRTLVAGDHWDLLVLPELANSGYLYTSPEELSPFAESGDGSGPFLTALSELAAEGGGMVITGFAERAAEGLYNAAAAVDANGVVQIYRKSHLFAGEKTLFLPGNSGFKVLEYRGTRIGMMVCFDWIFPEAARTLALRGAQILAHPANLVLPYCQQAMLTRSLENHVFSVTVNRWGEETQGKTHLAFTGASQVVDTKGMRLTQAPETGDHLQWVEINPAQANDKRVTLQNDIFADRRPDLYSS